MNTMQATHTTMVAPIAGAVVALAALALTAYVLRRVPDRQALRVLTAMAGLLAALAAVLSTFGAS